MSSPQSSDSSPFVSAPTSPTRTFSLDDVNFYSLPPSPIRVTWRSSYSCELGTQPATPVMFEDEAEPDMDDFEFDTGARFFVEDCDFETRRRPDNPAMGHERKASLPAMAFADELFCDGKVMPLRPPPRFLYGRSPGSLGSTPVSRNSPLKIPFHRRNLWNDDFDPFMSALENVKTESNGVPYRADNHRRARSMSPIRASYDWQPNEDFPVQDQFKQLAPVLPGPEKHEEPIGPYSIWIPNMSRGRPVLRPCKEVQKSPMKLAEPKGVVFARRARMVKMDYEWPKNLTKEPTTSMEGHAKAAAPRQKKSKKIKNFIRRSYSMIKTSDEHKQTDDHPKLPKSKSLRKKISKSLGLIQTKHEEKGVAEVTKMTLVQYYKPKLLLCMGFGAKYAN